MAGKLIIFSAPSGSGKSTIINYLLKQVLHLRFSISATSRAPRGTEKNGVEYYSLRRKSSAVVSLMETSWNMRRCIPINITVR